MSTHTTPDFLTGLPHGIDITAPGGIDELMAFHRRTFGDTVMQAADSEDPPEGDPKSKEPADTGKQEQSKTFTQEQLNAILAEEKRKHSEKYGDYDDLKAKADRLDQQETESQTELQKAIARAEKAEQDLVQEKTDREKSEREALSATVAAEKGVPVKNISGATREELEASADELISWRGEKKPKGAAYKPNAGTGESGSEPRAGASGRERAQQFIEKSKI